MAPIPDGFALIQFWLGFLGGFLGFIAYETIARFACWLFDKFFAHWLGRNHERD